MPSRTGTYIAFHADGNSEPTESDMKYYRLLQCWHENEHHEFRFTNSHDKTSGVRDTSLRQTLRRRLLERLACSKNLLLILGRTTKWDTDWVPFEICSAVDKYNLPIIAAYTAYSAIPPNSSMDELKAWWPAALTTRVTNTSARTLHIPFRQQPIHAALNFSVHHPPQWPVTFFSVQDYQRWGLLRVGP
jgi:MTH538 TIR-like domain (DUF1863)